MKSELQQTIGEMDQELHMRFAPPDCGSVGLAKFFREAAEDKECYEFCQDVTFNDRIFKSD